MINDRLDLVSSIIQSNALHQNLITLLKRTFDSPRLLQKFSFGRGDADDLISVAKTIRLSQHIATLLRNHTIAIADDTEAEKAIKPGNASFAKILSHFRFAGPMQLATQIMDSIDEEGLSEHHRLEETQVAETESTVEEVTDEVDVDGNEATNSRATFPTKYTHDTSAPSITQDDGDVWITKKKYVRFAR